MLEAKKLKTLDDADLRKFPDAQIFDLELEESIESTVIEVDSQETRATSMRMVLTTTAVIVIMTMPKADADHDDYDDHGKDDVDEGRC